MPNDNRTFWTRLLCWLGWHQEIGTTVANTIRCYACGRDYDETQSRWLEHEEFVKTSFYHARCQQTDAVEQ